MKKCDPVENCAWLCGLLVVLMDEDGYISEMAAKKKGRGK